MTTVTTDISWSGSWSRLYADVSDPNTATISSDAESSSIITSATSDDGDTVVLSTEAQQAINFDGGTGTGGLDAVAAIYSAAAAVINSSSSSDQEKIAAFGAAYTLTSLADIGTLGPAQNDIALRSYGAKFEAIAGDLFYNQIGGSSLMETFRNTHLNAPDSAPDFQKALSDILYDANDGTAYGVNTLSINLVETTTQAADGSTTTGYSFSYVQGQQTQAGTQDFDGSVDPMSAFSGAKTAKSTGGSITPYGAGSVLAVSVTKTIGFQNPQVTLEQEIADELFGSADSKDKTVTSIATNNTQTAPKDSQNGNAA